MSKTSTLSISQHIDRNFRNYALYVLENRGIPSFDDALTNVQRFILMNTPTQFQKTIAVVGSCISDGYHHGDASLVGAINKLARPYGNSLSLLEGDGFFGSSVDGTASAARYTSVKIHPKISEIIKKNHFLNTKNDNDGWNPLWLDAPIGLTTMIVGIGVGYKTTILPRKLEDIQKYLEGKIKEVKPHFQGFSGKVHRHQGLDRSWLISGCVETQEKNKTIKISDLPPLMKYTHFLKKLQQIMGAFADSSWVNQSSEKVEILIQHKGSVAEWEDLKMRVNKATQLVVTEILVFVKNGSVINYNRVEDYLDDYQYRIAHLRLAKIMYQIRVDTEELEYQRCKKEYLKFMLDCTTWRPQAEIDTYLQKITNKEAIRKRLNNIPLRAMSQDEYHKIGQIILGLEQGLEQLEVLRQQAEQIVHQSTDPTLSKSTVNSKNLFQSLLTVEDPEEIDGVECFNLDEEFGL